MLTSKSILIPTSKLRETMTRVVAETPVFDMHTHLFPPPFEKLLLWGVDELLTYHYLAAEVLKVSDIPYEQYWAMDKRAQADLIWKELFIERAPIGEACRGVLTVFKHLGCDTAERDLNAYRRHFSAIGIEEHIDRVFEAAGLSSVVMTNDPFDANESPVWKSGYKTDSRFKAALRIDPLLNGWEMNWHRLKEWGYDVGLMLTPATVKEVRRFLSDWIHRMDAMYMAVSFPPDFAFPEDSDRAKLIVECVLPTAAEHNIPFAMMIGVKRSVNPQLGLAGDGVGRADTGSVERLCSGFPENRFMVTMLARENQHELCVASRKFRNLLVFGCWWFLNNPSLIEEMTRMRIELLGLSVVPQHSDARVLEQVIYKWDHSRAIIAKVLSDKYDDLAKTGWTITEQEIERDVKRLLAGNFLSFSRTGVSDV
jgi:hypothetical protein